MIHFDEDKQNKKLRTIRNKEEEDLAQLLAARYGIPYINLATISIDTDGLRLLPEERARQAKMAIFDLVGKKMRVAILSPNRSGTQIELKGLEDRGYVVETFVCSTQSLNRAWTRYKDISFATETEKGTLDVSNEEIIELVSKVSKIEDIQKMIEDVVKMKKSFRISKIVEIIVAGAISLKASDIHVEPEENDVRLRFRLDGVLADIIRFDIETFNLLLSRIKLLSGMKLNIKNNAQEGRFTIKIDQDEIEVRTSVLPGAYNESIVMRLLNPKSIQVPMEELGIDKKLLDIFLREIGKPDGMVLNTGPTGSGKTTTLYAFMRHKKTPEVKIITIEDPIEYHLPGIVQTQVDVKKEYDFAKGLKSSLRQDPDVIMVGEIRDLDTAETAIHASLTGHLVFSTLHTNNAAGAFTRLIDLGINPKILTSAINIAIAQRLVRRLCDDCKKKVSLTDDKKEILKNVYDSIKNPSIPFTENVYEPVGCDKCNKFGYKGRIGIFEAVLSDKAVEEILQTNPSEREIKKAAENQGILDMSQDGVIKILKGITSLEEVERVVDLKNRSAHSKLDGGQDIINGSGDDIDKYQILADTPPESVATTITNLKPSLENPPEAASKTSFKPTPKAISDSDPEINSRENGATINLDDAEGLDDFTKNALGRK